MYLAYAAVHKSGRDCDVNKVRSPCNPCETSFTGISTPPQLCVTQSVIMVTVSTLVSAIAISDTKEKTVLSVSINIVCSSCIPLMHFMF